MDGYVYATPDGRVIKVFSEREKFDREVTAYIELTKRKVRTLLGLNVPILIDFDSNLMVLEMTMVQPPFLLDFASVLFEPPDFEQGAYSGWHDRMQFRFGANTWFVVAVYDALARLGLYYMDMHRGNLDFTGIEGIDAADQGPDDETTPD